MKNNVFYPPFLRCTQLYNLFVYLTLLFIESYINFQVIAILRKDMTHLCSCLKNNLASVI